MSRKETHYLNTDLELAGPVDLTPLARALSLLGLYNFHVLKEDGKDLWTARFETLEGFTGPEENITAFLYAIESLPHGLRKLWDLCSLREFDIGYDCGEQPSPFYHQITPVTLERITKVGAAIGITLYPFAE